MLNLLILESNEKFKQYPLALRFTIISRNIDTGFISGATSALLPCTKGTEWKQTTCNRAIHRSQNDREFEIGQKSRIFLEIDPPISSRETGYIRCGSFFFYFHPRKIIEKKSKEKYFFINKMNNKQFDGRVYFFVWNWDSKKGGGSRASNVNEIW